MRTLLASLLILVSLALPVSAAGPFTANIASGSTDVFVPLIAPTAYRGILDIALYFPDAEVTVSYWDYSDRDGDGSAEWVRLNNVGSASSYADSVSTIPAGVIERPAFRCKAIYVNRTDPTSGVVKWFR